MMTEKTMTWPAGFYSDGQHIGLRQNPTKPDFGWLVSETPASVAGVFTLNNFPAASVVLDREKLAATDHVRAVIVNSGNANSFTGQTGYQHAQQLCAAAAAHLGVPESEVLIASTGIIGQQLPLPKMLAAIPQLGQREPTAFARAILTTDTVTKIAQTTLTIAGAPVTITGVAKGSGMLHPNLGTMLSFIATDATIASPLLQQALAAVTDTTFNAVTIDGDTSTNDTVIVMANGQQPTQAITADTAEYVTFVAGLTTVMQDLAIQIARDGEGASRLVTVAVTGTETTAQARHVAKTIVGSSLVKSAIFGKDPNWGRIVCAIGNAGVPVSEDTLDIAINNVAVLEKGAIIEQSEALAAAMAADEIVITANLGKGSASGSAWGCDLTYEYVHINAMYHT